MKPHKESQGSAYEFTLGFCVNLKTTGTIEGKEGRTNSHLHWISLEIASKLQVKKLEKDTLEVQNGSKIIILHRDRRFCVHEHDYKAVRVIVEVNKTKTKEVV